MLKCLSAATILCVFKTLSLRTVMMADLPKIDYEAMTTSLDDSLAKALRHQVETNPEEVDFQSLIDDFKKSYRHARLKNMLKDENAKKWVLECPEGISPRQTKFRGIHDKCTISQMDRHRV